MIKWFNDLMRARKNQVRNLAAPAMNYWNLNLGMQRREAMGDPLEATEASSRAQILAQQREYTPLPTPPGRLKLRVFGENNKSVISCFGPFIFLKHVTLMKPCRAY